MSLRNINALTLSTIFPSVNLLTSKPQMSQHVRANRNIFAASKVRYTGSSWSNTVFTAHISSEYLWKEFSFCFVFFVSSCNAAFRILYTGVFCSFMSPIHELPVVCCPTCPFELQSLCFLLILKTSISLYSSCCFLTVAYVSSLCPFLCSIALLLVCSLFWNHHLITLMSVPLSCFPSYLFLSRLCPHRTMTCPCPFLLATRTISFTAIPVDHSATTICCH